MRNTIRLIIIALVALSFTIGNTENTYKLTEGQAIMISNAMALSKQILPTSQAPAITVVRISNDFDSIQKVLAVQYQNFHPDSLAKKK